MERRNRIGLMKIFLGSHEVREVAQVVQNGFGLFEVFLLRSVSQSFEIGSEGKDSLIHGLKNHASDGRMHVVENQIVFDLFSQALIQGIVRVPMIYKSYDRVLSDWERNYRLLMRKQC